MLSVTDRFNIAGSLIFSTRETGNFPKILSASEMRTVDKITTSKFSVPSPLLMENAGINLYLFLKSEFGKSLSSSSTVILCGKGNNGGDGLALARQLALRESCPNVVLLCRTKEIQGDAAIHLKAYLRSGGQVLSVNSQTEWDDASRVLDRCNIVVDALLGTGLGRPVDGLLADVVNDINRTAAFVLAVDIPTGIPSDQFCTIGPAVNAQATVTFTAPKIAHVLHEDQEAFGRIHITPIGTPPQLLESEGYFLNLMTKPGILSVLPSRKVSCHKGTFGHVAIISGSQGKSGAAVLSSRAALRSGSGLVTVVSPDTVQPQIASFQPEIMTEGLASTSNGTLATSSARHLLNLLKNKDSAGIGPGLSTDEETIALVRQVTREAAIPLVLDADALNAFSGKTQELVNQNGQPLILTPHPGEFSRLTTNSIPEIEEDRISIAQNFAKEHKTWIVLKGFRTLVASPDGQVYVCPLGNPGMATAGTGDVLTGILSSFLGQFRAQELNSPHHVTHAVISGVYLHSLAGDLASQKSGMNSLSAGDIIDHLGTAFSELLKDRKCLNKGTKST